MAPSARSQDSAKAPRETEPRAEQTSQKTPAPASDALRAFRGVALGVFVGALIWLLLGSVVILMGYD
jgi:hypothetical protein